jgi:hypothetical protein
MTGGWWRATRLLVREVYHSIRNELHIGSRRAEASSTTDTVRPMREAPVRTTVWARIRCCNSHCRCGAGHCRNHRRTVAGQNRPRHRRNNGTWDTRRSWRTRRRRWSISRNLERGHKHRGNSLPADKCPDAIFFVNPSYWWVIFSVCVCVVLPDSVCSERDPSSLCLEGEGD